MHFDYEIRLPDHDFVNVAKHKLTPSVYSACEIRTTSSKVASEIYYSGPTYIVIRSGNHSSSTAYSHGCGLDHVLKLEEFKSIVKSEIEVKPVAMIYSDGGTDENPRFPKTLDYFYPCTWFVRLQPSGEKNGSIEQSFGGFTTSIQHIWKPSRLSRKDN